MAINIYKIPCTKICPSFITSESLFTGGCNLNVTFEIDVDTYGWTAEVDFDVSHPYTLQSAWGGNLVTYNSSQYVFNSYDTLLETAGTYESLFFTIYTTDNDICITPSKVCYTYNVFVAPTTTMAPAFYDNCHKGCYVDYFDQRVLDSKLIGPDNVSHPKRLDSFN